MIRTTSLKLRSATPLQVGVDTPKLRKSGGVEMAGIEPASRKPLEILSTSLAWEIPSKLDWSCFFSHLAKTKA